MWLKGTTNYLIAGIVRWNKWSVIRGKEINWGLWRKNIGEVG